MSGTTSAVEMLWADFAAGMAVAALIIFFFWYLFTSLERTFTNPKVLVFLGKIWVAFKAIGLGIE